MDEERYEGIKASFGMWMYESFETILHIQNYNFEKLGINKIKRCPTKFTRPEMIEMAIAIFNKRVDLELLTDNATPDSNSDHIEAG